MAHLGVFVVTLFGLGCSHLNADAESIDAASPKATTGVAGEAASKPVESTPFMLLSPEGDAFQVPHPNSDVRGIPDAGHSPLLQPRAGFASQEGSLPAPQGSDRLRAGRSAQEEGHQKALSDRELSNRDRAEISDTHVYPDSSVLGEAAVLVPRPGSEWHLRSDSSWPPSPTDTGGQGAVPSVEMPIAQPAAKLADERFEDKSFSATAPNPLSRDELASPLELSAEGDFLKIDSIRPPSSIAFEEGVVDVNAGRRVSVRLGSPRFDTQEHSATERKTLAGQSVIGATTDGKNLQTSLENLTKGRDLKRVKTGSESALQGNSEQRLKPFRGEINGLTQAGLVLTDAMGNVLRPRPGAETFEFQSGDAYLPLKEKNQLIIVRQPLGQTCRVEKSKQSAFLASISCASSIDPKRQAQKPEMRDCFRVSARGAAFTLGYRNDGDVRHAWQPYADVTMDPLGINRQQHKTFVNGRVILEAIVHLPLATPVANIEWLSFSGGVEGESIQRTGKVGGLPLDLKVGETRTFTVTASNQDALQPQARLASIEQRVKLVSIAPLDTQAGHFPLTCRLEEGAVGGGGTTNTWYAPGYGTVKVEVLLPGGGLRTLEAIEIQQYPN